MANVKLVFQGSFESETHEHELVCFSNTQNNIYIEIAIQGFDTSFICLNKSTAIKFHRELKKQISFLESEVINE